MHKSVRALATAAVLAILTFPGRGVAGPWTEALDGGFNDGSGGATFNTYSMSWRVETPGELEVRIRTGFPLSGTTGGSDSYGGGPWTAGDLYIQVNGTFQSIIADGGYTTKYVVKARNAADKIYGLAMTSHSGNLTNDTRDDSYWTTAVSQGQLYSNAQFATGTYELYEQAVSGEVPDDGGLNDGENSYPTMLMNGSAVAGAVSAVTSVTVNQPSYKYELLTSFKLADVGVTSVSDSIQLFWAMECGNDGAQVSPFFLDEPDLHSFVPEPGVMWCLGLGVAPLFRRRRR